MNLLSIFKMSYVHIVNNKIEFYNDSPWSYQLNYMYDILWGWSEEKHAAKSSKRTPENKVSTL